MKIIPLAIIVFLLFGGTATLQAQAEAEQKSFSYNYGILIGNNLKQFDLEIEDINVDDLIAGLTAVLQKNTTIDNKTAQQEVNKKLKALKQKLVEKRLIKNKVFMAKNAEKEGVLVTPSGIQYEILEEGHGKVSPKPTDKVLTHYHGTLIDGTVFDSSVERNQPIDFPVSNVIQGWQEMLQMMKVGDKYRVFIPPHLAYGSRPQGKIPGNSVLIFEMELIKIN